MSAPRLASSSAMTWPIRFPPVIRAALPPGSSSARYRTKPPPAPPPASSRRTIGRRLLIGDGAALTDDGVPVIDEGRGAAVDVEPGERFAEDAAVGERALGARIGGEVAHPP